VNQRCKKYGGKEKGGSRLRAQKCLCARARRNFGANGGPGDDRREGGADFQNSHSDERRGGASNLLKAAPVWCRFTEGGPTYVQPRQKKNGIRLNGDGTEERNERRKRRKKKVKNTPKRGNVEFCPSALNKDGRNASLKQQGLSTTKKKEREKRRDLTCCGSTHRTEKKKIPTQERKNCRQGGGAR